MTGYRLDVAAPKRPPAPEILLDLQAAHARARAAWQEGEKRAAQGDLKGGLAWLGRAHRMAPADQNLAFALALLRLRAGLAEDAAILFEAMANRHDVRECWVGLAAASLQCGRPEAARHAAQQALSRHAADPALVETAHQVSDRCGLPGWCGLRGDGVVLAGGWTPFERSAPEVELDGRAVVLSPSGTGAWRLPEGWRTASRLSAFVGGRALGRALLGSPIALDRLLRVEGFLERRGGAIAGWAWHPAMPDLDPVLTIEQHTGDATSHAWQLTATAELAEVEGTRPLFRPRGFEAEAAPGARLRVTGSDQRPLLGSPLPPVDTLAPPAGDIPASQHKPPKAEPALPVDVIIPVYRGLRTTLDCLDSVIATVMPPHRIVVVDDRTPEAALAQALGDLARAGAITLVRPAETGGFPAAVNAGLDATQGRHVVLLNSDTLVAPGWLEGLLDAACSASDIGTATPLSNEATIFSYPDPEGGNPAPDLAGTRRLASLAAQANAGRLINVPTAHGFCMFIRHDCLQATGRFEAAVFAQGYGEENDFTERARLRGYRHVAVPSVYVAHIGGVSFAGAGFDLLRRNQAILRRRHPGYSERVEAFLKKDALWPARRRLDEARWRNRPDLGTFDGGAVLLISHGGGGGTTRIVAERAEALRREGRRPIVLRAVNGACELGDAEDRYPNLAFVLPRELAALRKLLAAEHPVGAEIHHLLGHDHSVMRLIASLEIPYDVWVHDYAWFCARISFVTGDGRFCGEAPASVCETCLAKWGRGIDDPIGPASLRRRSETDLIEASRIIVPSADVARRVIRHVPGARPDIRPWEEAWPRRRPAIQGRPGRRRRVAVVGAIGLEKGSGVLLACAQDAAARALPLEFVVVGYTEDDETLLRTGRVFVTGEFTRAEAEALIRAQDAHLAFLPSVWPETWCYALSDVWRAGLSAAVFDIGTPADRVRSQGGGWVLPLGLPAPRVNEVLLSLV